MTDTRAGTFVRQTLCQSCGQPIIFIQLKSGRSNPVDADSKARITKAPNGTPWVTTDGEIVIGIEDPGGELIGCRSHFATCPNADAHRKMRKSDRKKAGAAQ